MIRTAIGFACIASLITAATDALADEFADEVVDYAPVIQNGNPLVQYRHADNALGAPDAGQGGQCPTQEICDFVTLGDGGSLTVRFTDNALTGSGDASSDIWIYEVGPDVEDTFVEISADNTTWHSIGKVLGATSSIDIDQFGFGLSDQFFYVRLTDDPDEGSSNGPLVGADIDAVEALSFVEVPTISTSWGRIKVRFE